jgi:protoporphyrinogen oxidase
MMWEAVADLIQRRNSSVRMNTGVNKIFWAHGKVTGLEVEHRGEVERVRGTHFISSMPIRELIRKLDPAPPPEVQAAADDLKYRDFITVALLIDKAELFPDNWIYVHDPDVKVGRIQNFKNWSPEMVPDPSKTCLGLEYFCFEGDSLWTMPDADIVRLATRELAALGLVREEQIIDGTVVRMPKAYPVYDSTYMEALRKVREFLLPLSNLHLVGRNGMHKYNNQDHSMLTAMLAVENILGANHDIWQVNVDQDYHEEVRAKGDAADDQLALLRSTQPRVPQRKEKS